MNVFVELTGKEKDQWLQQVRKQTGKVKGEMNGNRAGLWTFPHMVGLSSNQACVYTELKLN